MGFCLKALRTCFVLLGSSQKKTDKVPQAVLKGEHKTKLDLIGFDWYSRFTEPKTTRKQKNHAVPIWGVLNLEIFPGSSKEA